ncbi:MAG TPA: POTRA domain-containing protein [Candidatus Sulfotelmatobacter sp.]|nr:POTRA domain-containing protein [Candidatus Sulfotelmatobacter sp.]
MAKRYAILVTAMSLLWLAGLSSRSCAQQASQAGSAAYEGKTVDAVDLPEIDERDRQHLLDLLPQKAGFPLRRDLVRESIRVLYATGRFADIQAEVSPVGDRVRLNFATSPNFFVGAINVEGATARPTANQIVNASKLQLGELFTADKLNRALENIRQLMEENGYRRARVTAEDTSNPSTQQVDVLFHVTAGSQAHVGEVKVTGTSGLTADQVRELARMQAGERVTAARVSGSLQRLRKRFQKQNRALAQVSIAEQVYHPETNALDFTYQIEPGPVVLISARGYRISRGTLKREIPVYEENAVDDDLLNEGRRNLLDYLQTRGHFDAKVEIRKETEPKIMRVIYDIDPGPLHKLAMIEITGNKNFLDTAKLRSYLQIQAAHRFLTHGRYSETLLKSDVATLENLYRSNGFHEVQIKTKVDDNYQGSSNKLAVHIDIEEGVRTRAGQVNVLGNDKVKTSDLPELSTQSGQPYSQQELANDRERILSYYFDHGFPNATLEIGTKPSASEPNREDVTFSIQEGEHFTVDQVMVAGTEHTRDYVVQRELQVHSADPLSQQDLLNTQTRLYNLGIFSQVDTAVQNPEGGDPQKNVLVQVREAKRYTFTYGVGLEFQTGQPAGTTAPQGTTGVSPRVEFDVTRLNLGGRNQTLTFQSHVGRLQQRGLVSYTVPKLLDSDKWKLIYTIFYDNSLDVATFTSQRLEGKIDLRQQIGNAGTEPGTRPGPSSITYRFDFRRVKASNFARGFSAGEIALLSLPARVGGPGFTFIRDKRDNPLESTKGNYFTLDGFTALGLLGSEADFGRLLAQNSTYQAFGGKGRPGRQFVFARSTAIGLEQPFRGTRVRPPGACVTDPNTNESFCEGFNLIPLPEQFFAGGGNSHRGFGLNQAGPRDPSSGFPVGGTALFVNNLELRFPQVSLPYLGEGFGFAVFHDMGNVFTAQHDMLKGLMRWHQPSTQPCVSSGTPSSQDCTAFNNSGYDYTSHAVGVGVRYKTPIGPLRFDFGYDLNPTRFFQNVTRKDPATGNPITVFEAQRLRHFNVFFSIGQPF